MKRTIASVVFFSFVLSFYAQISLGQAVPAAPVVVPVGGWVDGAKLEAAMTALEGRLTAAIQAAVAAAAPAAPLAPPAGSTPVQTQLPASAPSGALPLGTAPIQPGEATPVPATATNGAQNQNHHDLPVAEVFGQAAERFQIVDSAGRLANGIVKDTDGKVRNSIWIYYDGEQKASAFDADCDGVVDDQIKYDVARSTYRVVFTFVPVDNTFWIAELRKPVEGRFVAFSQVWFYKTVGGVQALIKPLTLKAVNREQYDDEIALAKKVMRAVHFGNMGAHYNVGISTDGRTVEPMPTETKAFTDAFVSRFGVCAETEPVQRQN